MRNSAYLEQIKLYGTGNLSDQETRVGKVVVGEKMKGRVGITADEKME